MGEQRPCMSRALFGFAALALFIPFTAVYGIDINKVNKLAQECQAGKAKSCAKLADIARSDEDWNIRTAAIGKLTNSAVLAEIARNDKVHSFSYALAHNPNLIDQEALADIVTAARAGKDDFDTGMAALARISDQQLLDDIVMNGKNEDICLAALERITDQARLADIARNNVDEDIRKAAAKRLTDPVILAALIADPKIKDIRALFVTSPFLTDQALLAGIAQKDPDREVREAAVAKLVSQPLLLEIIKNDKAWNVRRTAVANPHLVDREFLFGLAENDSSGLVRGEAARKLPENHRLRKCILASAEEIRSISDQALLAEIAKRASELDNAWAAMAKVTDQALLVDIARTSLIEWTRDNAVDRIENREKLTAFSNDKQQPLRLRYRAVLRLKDSERFKVPAGQIAQSLLELRQESISQKDLEAFKSIHWDLTHGMTPQAVLELRKKLPKAVVKGRLLKRGTGEPLARTPIFLAEMKGEQSCDIYSDIMTVTDDKGNFLLNGVPNGFYTIVYSLSQKAKLLPSAVFSIEPKEFNTTMQNGVFNSYNTLTEGTLTWASIQLGISLNFEVRDAHVVEFDVYGTGTRIVEFEIYQ